MRSLWYGTKDQLWLHHILSEGDGNTTYSLYINILHKNALNIILKEVFFIIFKTTKIVVMRALCHGTEYQLWLHHILLEGGEGVMLRKAGSSYEGGRTNSLMKLKVFFVKQKER
jgi:hypothetical protein